MERVQLDWGVDKLLRLSIRLLSDVNYNRGKTADRYLAAGSLHPSQVFSHEMFLQFYKLLLALMDYSAALSKLCQLLINI